MTAMIRHSAKALTDGWMSFLRLLATNTGIDFEIGPNQSPATNGKKVWMPSLPLNLTMEDLILFKSNGYHEVGHILHSDVPFFMAFAAQHGEFAGFLLNALDDVYMENRQSRFTREADIYFRQSGEILFKRKQFRDGSASPAEAVACYTLCYLHSKSRIEFKAPLEVITENFNRHFGEHAESVKANLDEILTNEFPSVQSTQHGGALTLRIIAMLKALSDEEEKKNEQGKKPDQTQGNQEGEKSPQGDSGNNQGGGNSDEKQPGQSGGNSEGQKDGKNGNGNQNDPAQPKGGEGEGKGANAGDEKGGKAGEGKSAAQGGGANGPSLKEIVDGIVNATNLGKQEVFDARAAVEGIAKDVARGTHPDYKGKSVVPAFKIDGKPTKPSDSKQPGGGAGPEQQLVDGMKFCPDDRDEARVLVSKLDRKVQVLATRLQAMLMNQEEADAFSTHRGVLGESHLYRLGLGDTRVFTQQEEVERPTAAVSLLADLSVSTMDKADKVFAKLLKADDESAEGKKLQSQGSAPASIARSIAQSLLIFEKVLDQIGTPREILGFAPNNGQLMSVVRTFGDSYQTALNRIGGMRRIAGGNHTPIGEAVFHAGRRLMAHDAQKKVMFVLTDGAPSNIEKAKEMTLFCQDAGIRVVYLIIGEKVRTDWLTEASIPFACAKTADELGPVLIDEAKKLLM